MELLLLIVDRRTLTGSFKLANCLLAGKQAEVVQNVTLSKQEMGARVRAGSVTAQEALVALCLLSTVSHKYSWAMSANSPAILSKDFLR